jgi:hypothetical protein
VRAYHATSLFAKRRNSGTRDTRAQRYIMYMHTTCAWSSHSTRVVELRLERGEGAATPSTQKWTKKSSHYHPTSNTHLSTYKKRYTCVHLSIGVCLPPTHTGSPSNRSRVPLLPVALTTTSSTGSLLIGEIVLVRRLEALQNTSIRTRTQKGVARKRKHGRPK